jgi:hypothetical protein
MRYRPILALALAAAATASATTGPADARTIASHSRTAVAASATSPAASDSPSTAARADAAPSTGLSMPGLAWSAGLPYPPDQFGAIGPEHYVQGVTNTGVAVFRRSDLGLAAGPVPAGSFAAAPPSVEVVDTQMMWDQQTSRWYYAFAYKRWSGNTRTAGLLYGWSRTADPTDLAHGWCRMRIDNGADFDDRPKLGDNRTHLIIATNADPWAGNDYNRVWTMPKPDDGDTGCPASQSGLKVFGTVAQPLKTSDGDVVDSAIVAQDNDGAANGWIVAADDRAASDSQIMLWHVNASGDLVADGNIDVAAFSEPPAAPQPSPGQPLDPVDQRLNSAIADRDPDAGTTAVWTSHTIRDPAGSGRSIVRWYELVPSACAPVTGGTCSPAVRRQQGEVKDGSSWLFNAAMAPTDAGDEAVLHYNSASPFQTVQVRARARSANTELDSLGDEIVIDSSDAVYDEPTCHDARPYCRWGDYSAATTDPVDHHLVWGSNQATGPANGGKPHWKTRNFALAPAPADAAPQPPPVGPDPGGSDPGGGPGGNPVPPVEPPGPHRPNAVTVMSRNLAGAHPAEPDARMALVALEIVRTQPDLVGLQRAGNLVPRLGTELKRLGGSYRVVSRSRRPGSAVVLARKGVRVSRVGSGASSNQLDAAVEDRRIHFVNAWLVPGSRLRQARQLLRGPLKPRRLPTVLVGDLGSGPRLVRQAARLPHRALVRAGFAESRTLEPSCCFDSGLRTGLWDRVVDHVMTRPKLPVALSFVTGYSARTPGGHAASDHGGVVTVLRVKR